MSIQKEIILRYRSSSQLRFELPAKLCAADVATVVEGELHRIEGVYRVMLYRRQRKLSIRFFDTVTDAPAVARQMHGILGELIEEGLLEDSVRGAEVPKREGGKPKGRRVKNQAGPTTRLANWFRNKVQEGKETLSALKILAGKGGGEKVPALLQNPERAAFEFANDILVFYLIKIHWNRIVYEWLPQPFRFRYQWLALIYMTYLWVRWRHTAD